jgi:hypothetical protein
VIARLEGERRTYYEAYGANPPTVRAQAAMIALDQLKLIEDCWDEQGVEIIATKEAARLHPLMKLVNRAHALGTLVSWDMQKR